MTSENGYNAKLYGVLVTFERPQWLGRTLDRMAEQQRPLDHLVVIDNGPRPETRAIVHHHAARGLSVDYVPMPENLGFTGGVEAGMRRVLEVAADEDWIVILDDDDLAPSVVVLGELEQFARDMLSRDPRTACVGIGGGRFDWRRGRIRRVPDDELNGAVAVDYVGGNQLGFYLVRAVRALGPFHGRLFFGLSEIEFGLRLRRAGYSLYGNGPLWLVNRNRAGRLGVNTRPSLRLPELRWRRYYTLRNTIYVLRRFGHPFVAARVTLIQGLGKPLANLVVTPRAAIRHLALNVKACRDGWRDRMGRTVEPDSRSKREEPSARGADQSC